MPLKEEVRWNGEAFEYKHCWEQEDVSRGETDQKRTTDQMVLAMSSIIEFLEFEGEESGMIGDGRLPTLDTSIWVDETSGRVLHSFFEKPICPNRVLKR